VPVAVPVAEPVPEAEPVDSDWANPKGAAMIVVSAIAKQFFLNISKTPHFNL